MLMIRLSFHPYANKDVIHPLYINPLNIIALARVDYRKDVPPYTLVDCVDNKYYHVIETIEQIEKLIELWVRFSDINDIKEYLTIKRK